MFNFKSKKLNPVMAGVISKFQKASSIDNPTERVEALMLLKEEANSHIHKINLPEQSAALAAVGLVLVGHVLTMPIILVSGLLWFGKKSLNSMRASRDKKILFNQIDTVVSEVVNKNINDATASPTFMKSLKHSFRQASEATEKDFSDLVKRTKQPSANGPAAS